MKKEILVIAILIAGCTPSSTKVLMKTKKNEIALLQKIKKEILLRPTSTPKEMLTKKFDLEMINNQILLTMKAQDKVQNIQNQKTNNIKN